MLNRLFLIFFELGRYLLVKFFILKIQSNYKATNKIFVTLTTTPERIRNIGPTIRSLLNQSCTCDKIILNIPKLYRGNQPYILPEWLKSYPSVFINEIEIDLGPASKLLPTLNLNFVKENDVIIVVDDDQIYPYRLIENYDQAVNSQKAAFCLCGWKVPEDKTHKGRKPILGAGIRILEPFTKLTSDKQVDILQGASSFCVKSGFFDTSVFDYSSAPVSSFFVDDIWFSGHLARMNIPIYVLKTEMPYARMESKPSMRKTGLVNTSNLSDHHNNTLYEYFTEYWMSVHD